MQQSTQLHAKQESRPCCWFMQEQRTLGSCAFEPIDGHKFRLRTGVQLHMFISQPPCGDACSLECSFPDSTAALAHGIAPDDSVNKTADPPQNADKCKNCKTRGRQLNGQLQRKPGRGDTTLSMSCSDKLARWTMQGIQVNYTVTHAYCAITAVSLTQMVMSCCNNLPKFCAAGCAAHEVSANTSLPDIIDSAAQSATICSAKVPQAVHRASRTVQGTQKCTS